MPAPDPWTAFLEWLTTVIVPAWGELVSMLPLFLLLGVVGPLLTIIVLMWAWYLLHRTRGRVRTIEPEGAAVPVGPGGEPVYPVNLPWCREHAVAFPPSQTTCTVDGAELQVTCPVDGTVRPAAIQVCAGCGTRFVLGAGRSPLEVRTPAGPPEGGAAAA